MSVAVIRACRNDQHQAMRGNTTRRDPFSLIIVVMFALIFFGVP